MSSPVDPSIIESITCPITRDIMREPVVARDGQTYEKTAIIAWLSNHNNSPITNDPIYIDDLKVNPNIRFLIDKYNSGAFGDINAPKPNSSSKFQSNNKIRLKSSNQINHKDQVMITIETDDATIPTEFKDKTLPQDLIVIIDRSGSMGISVEAKDANGDLMEDGLSQLDLVSYATRTMAATLKNNDRMAIIAFDNQVSIEYNLMEMDEINFNSLVEVLKTIEKRGSTNIWHALQAGLNMINEREDKSRNAHIVLLTDGVPNSGTPAQGEVKTLSGIHDKLNFSTSINTIGFGYNLQPGLLYGLSKVGNGITAHIPDGGMIATVFNHLTGTILCTAAMNLQLTVKLTNGYTFEKNPICGDFKYKFMTDDKTEIIVNVGTVQLEQSRNIVLNIESGCWVDKTMRDSILYSYSYKIGGNTSILNRDFKSLADGGSSSVCMKSQLARYFVIEEIINGIKAKNDELQGKPVKKTTKMIYDEMVEFLEDQDMDNEFIKGLYETLTDQVYKAFSLHSSHCIKRNGIVIKTFYEKWGLLYLEQLCSHLNNEKRSNFRDLACQLFGGKIFEETVDYGSDKFNSLTPPVPSNAPYIYDSKSVSPRGISMPPPLACTRVTTSSYNSQDRGNPCFDGDCYVTTQDGSFKKVKNLVKGDNLMSLTDHCDASSLSSSKLVCILKTKIKEGVLEMSELPNTKMSNALITNWHPVFYDGKWVPACKVGSVKKVFCDYVYSFVLENNHVVFVNEYPCITLGHNFSTSGLKHSYLVTNVIIYDLMRMDGWDKGLITINQNNVKRGENGLICKISP